MNYSYVSTPTAFPTTTTETVIRFTRGAGGEGQVDRIASADPRDIIQFFGENLGATDISVQAYGVMNQTDDPLLHGAAIGSPLVLATTVRGGITLQGATGGWPFYAFSADAASATPTLRAIVSVKSGT